MEEKLAKYRAKKKATEKSSSPFSNVAEYFKREVSEDQWCLSTGQSSNES